MTSAGLIHFPQLLFPRLRRALTRLALSVWHDPVPVEVSRTASRRGDFSLAQAQKAKLRPVTLPCAWQAPGFSTSWFRLRLPPGYRARPGDHLQWDDNAEATAWLKGRPVCGFDATHRHWPWPRRTQELWLESIFCQSGIWHAAAKGIGPVGSILHHARLVRKDEAAWHAYFDLEVICDWLEEEIRRAHPAEAEQLLAGFRTWPEMDGASGSFLPDGVGTGVANRWRPELDRLAPLLRRVMRLTDEALTAYHNRGPSALSRELRAVYALLREREPSSRAVLTGHAHVDLVWLWPEATGEQKAVRTFATVNALLRRYPEFHFGYSQPASYEAVGRRSPALMAEVRSRIRAGRWEPTGAMQVESDTLLPCGEALLRSLLIGQEGFRRLQGKVSPVLWLPDAFGFSGCLPAVMRLAGVEYFFTNKLSWNALHRFPHSSFVWRGSDGTEVLAHVSRATNYNNPARLRNLRLEAEANRQADVHPEFLLPSGWGDGGGGPTADMIERVRRQGDLRNQPSARWGRIDEFYRGLDKSRSKLPVWRGEIYLEAHRGTYTTQGLMKSVYRRLERALQANEAVRCVQGRGPADSAAWRRLIFAQFHDCLPGSSVHEVYEAIIPELEQWEARLLADAVGGKKNRREGGKLFNPLPLALPYSGPEGSGMIPPLSWARFDGAPSFPALRAERVAGQSTTLSGPGVAARFDRQGTLVQLSVDGAPTLEGCPRLIRYRDIPHDLEAWEIDRQVYETGQDLKLRTPGTMRSGPGWSGVAQVWATAAGSVVELLWRLREGFTVLELEATVDWREPETLLRLEVPTLFRGQSALFGAPFGGEWRSQQPGDPRQSAQWEVPASRWALAADDGRQEGAFLLAAAKYGFSARDGVLGVSLLKSAKATVTTAFPAAFRAGPPRAPFSDLGRQVIRLGLGRLGVGSPREAYPAACAETLFALPLSGVAAPPLSSPIFPAIEGLASVIPAWAVPLAEGGWILRLHETMGRAGRIKLAPPSGWSARVLRQAIPGAGDRPLAANGELAIGPFAVLGIELKRMGSAPIRLP